MEMGLSQWLKNGWLRNHQPTKKEIDGLLAIVERDFSDAPAGSLSGDWRFGIAYNAALKLCAILLHAEGFKAEKNLTHCRAKRNTAEYDSVGVVTLADADELVDFIREFKPIVLEWLKKNHPELI